MISNMIDHDGSDVHIYGIPSMMSGASRAFWNALSSEELLGWYGGKIKFSSNLKPDPSAGLITHAQIKSSGVPSFFLDMLVSMDLEIPPAEIVLSSLDSHVVAISLDSPAFNIPEKAEIKDLALCVAASRIAWEIRGSLIRPTHVSEAEMEHALRDVGINALLIGGVEVYPYAKALLSDPDLWVRSASVDTQAMEFGEDQHA